MSVNSRHKSTKIIDQRRALYRQGIPDYSCASQGTVDIDILVTSTNRHRKIMQSIITSKEVEPVQPLQVSIYQINTYRKELSWRNFEYEPRVQERLQVKDQKFCVSVFVAYPSFQFLQYFFFYKSSLKLFFTDLWY